MILAVFVKTVFISMGAKVRLSEQKTKFYLSFLEREYLRAKLKDSANRAKYQIYLRINN